VTGVSKLHTTHYTLYTTHYTLYTTHYTLHTIHYTPIAGKYNKEGTETTKFTRCQR